MNDSEFKYKKAACLSDGICNTPGLEAFTGAKSHYSTRGINADRQFKDADLIVDWGNKRFEITSKLKARDNKPVLSLEDGFIRSMGLGVEGSRSFAMVSDWTGIYYDARRASDLENILQGIDHRSEQISLLSERSRQCIKRITENNISKYNQAPDRELPATDKRRILLVDQTFGDQSIISGIASERSFKAMLGDASQETDAEILIKTHPDVIAGKKQGYLCNPDTKANYPENVTLIHEDINPLALIKQVDEVRVVTSQMGFEACMLGKPVHCYGMPFYAGWGITEDKIECSRRTLKRSVEEVFSAAYLLYTSYIHPETQELTQLENILDHIERQKEYWKANEGHFICIGFDRWKHRYVRNYLRSNNNRIEFSSRLKPENISPQTRIVVWGENISDECKEIASNHSIPLIAMEDGFIRSIDLGKYGTEPRSLVVDRGGIYFDPESCSDLETILETAVFSNNDLESAAKAIQIMTNSKISKYNVGSKESLTTNVRQDQTLILVPGQVGIDASIKRGCDQIATNIDLLKKVREINPDAYILYKPHPDIVSGNINEETENDYERYTDQIETSANIHSCLTIADEIHTMTSLVGFEALLLGKKVHTYGRPFYAGWGLTTDHSLKDFPRRNRQLNIEELVAGTLIKYPRYIHPKTSEFTTAIQILEGLQSDLENKGTAKLHTSWLARWALKVRYGGLGIIRSWTNLL